MARRKKNTGFKLSVSGGEGAIDKIVRKKESYPDGIYGTSREATESGELLTAEASAKAKKFDELRKSFAGKDISTITSEGMETTFFDDSRMAARKKSAELRAKLGELSHEEVAMFIEEAKKQGFGEDLGAGTTKEYKQKLEREQTEVNEEAIQKERDKKNFFSRVNEFNKRLQLSPQNIIEDPAATLGARAGAGAVAGIVAAAPSLGLAISAKALAAGAGAVLGADALATWLTADNFQSSIPFQLNDVQGALEGGVISRQEASSLYEQAEKQIEFTDKKINISTMINPLLWPARKRYMAQSDNTKNAVAIKKLRAGL